MYKSYLYTQTSQLQDSIKHCQLKQSMTLAEYLEEQDRVEAEKEAEVEAIEEDGISD